MSSSCNNYLILSTMLYQDLLLFKDKIEMLQQKWCVVIKWDHLWKHKHLQLCGLLFLSTQSKLSFRLTTTLPVCLSIPSMDSSQLNIFRMAGGGKKPPSLLPLGFPLQLLQTLELVPKTFWLLVLTLWPHWCKISSSYLVPVPNYWFWTKTTPQKKQFFWSDPHKIEVITTSLLKEMLELPNFGHMTTFTL